MTSKLMTFKEQKQANKINNNLRFIKPLAIITLSSLWLYIIIQAVVIFNK